MRPSSRREPPSDGVLVALIAAAAFVGVGGPIVVRVVSCPVVATAHTSLTSSVAM